MTTFEQQVQDTAAQLKTLADFANLRASQLRTVGCYDEAQLYDQRAEALRCAASLAETRGLQS